MATPITIRKTSSNKHNTDKYAIVPINILGKNTKRAPIITRFRREIHLIQNFKTNIPLKSDILGPKQFSIDLKKKEIFIGNCGMTILLDIGIKNDSPAVQKIVHIRQIITILLYTKQTVSI